jgi:hypothetical protein
MALKGYVAPTITLKIQDTDFTVRGLNLADLTVILQAHEPMMTKLFNDYTTNENADSDLAAVGLSLVNSAPELIAHIVCIAADEPDSGKEFMSLPIATQLEAIEAVGKLTFEASGGVKKLIEIVARLMRQITSGMTELRQSKSSSLA